MNAETRAKGKMCEGKNKAYAPCPSGSIQAKLKQYICITYTDEFSTLLKITPVTLKMPPL